MTLDSAERLAGYYPSHWPAECAGPRRQKRVASPGLALKPDDRLRSTHRELSDARWPVMIVVREPGEVFVQGCTRFGTTGNSFGWVERIDPVSLEPQKQSPRLPSGGHNWCGAATVHENGDLYVVNGCYCHRLTPDLEVVAERKLPVDNAHNGHLILSDGNLVTKDIQNDPAKRSVFTVMSPSLEVIDRFELPENSVGRFSSDRALDEDHLYVTSPTRIYRLRYRAGMLSLDDTWIGSYAIPGEDQSFAWDSCIGSDSVWFQDMGENRGVQAILAAHPVGTNPSPFSPSALRLARIASRLGLSRFLPADEPVEFHAAPVRVFRFSLSDARDRDVLVPFGESGGFIDAPPLYDPERRILVAFDITNAKVGAWRYHRPREYELLWTRPYRNTSQMTLYADTGELLLDDVKPPARWDALVVDIETGKEKGRVDTGCVRSGGMWYTPGFARDFYLSTPLGFLGRVWVE